MEASPEECAEAGKGYFYCEFRSAHSCDRSLCSIKSSSNLACRSHVTVSLERIIKEERCLTYHLNWIGCARSLTREPKWSPNSPGASVRFPLQRAWSERGLNWWLRSGESGAMYQKSMRLATSTRGAGSVTKNPY